MNQTIEIVIKGGVMKQAIEVIIKEMDHALGLESMDAHDYLVNKTRIRRWKRILTLLKQDRDAISTWAEEVYLYLSDQPGAAEKSLMARLRAIRAGAVPKVRETPHCPACGEERCDCEPYAH